MNTLLSHVLQPNLYYLLQWHKSQAHTVGLVRRSFACLRSECAGASPARESTSLTEPTTLADVRISFEIKVLDQLQTLDEHIYIDRAQIDQRR